MSMLGGVSNPFSSSESVSDGEMDNRKIVPYDDWPTFCYACSSNIEQTSDSSNMFCNERGQFVVHRGESPEETVGVGLCSECTVQFMTIIDHWDEFKPAFNSAEQEDEEKND